VSVISPAINCPQDQNQKSKSSRRQDGHDARTAAKVGAILVPIGPTHGHTLHPIAKPFLHREKSTTASPAQPTSNGVNTTKTAAAVTPMPLADTNARRIQTHIRTMATANIHNAAAMCQRTHERGLCNRCRCEAAD